MSNIEIMWECQTLLITLYSVTPYIAEIYPFQTQDKYLF